MSRAALTGALHSFFTKLFYKRVPKERSGERLDWVRRSHASSRLYQGTFPLPATISLAIASRVADHTVNDFARPHTTSPTRSRSRSGRDRLQTISQFLAPPPQTLYQPRAIGRLISFQLLVPA